MKGAKGEPQQDGAGGLWHLLEERRDEILSRWIAHVRRDILPGDLP